MRACISASSRELQETNKVQKQSGVHALLQCVSHLQVGSALPRTHIIQDILDRRIHVRCATEKLTV
jgi:hypothetical protein